jgi:hypothetical protein
VLPWNLLNVIGTCRDGLKIAEPINVTLSPLQMVAEVGVTVATKGGKICTVLVKTVELVPHVAISLTV